MDGGVAIACTSGNCAWDGQMWIVDMEREGTFQGLEVSEA